MNLSSAFRRASIAAAFLLTSPALAQSILPSDGVRFSANTRLRYEFIENQVRPGFNPDEAIVDVRTVLSATAQIGRLQLVGELWDSRVYDADAGSAISTNEVNSLEPVQAYARYELGSVLGLGTRATAQLGRFTLNLGSRRLVAADDYRNTTNGYTGLRADVRLRGGANVTLIYTLPQQRIPSDTRSLLDDSVEINRESFNLVLWGIIAAQPNVAAGATAEAAYYRLAEHDDPGRPTRDRNLHTTSARLIREPATGIVDFEVEGAYQFGTVSRSTAVAASQQDVSATFIHADVGYTFRGPLKLRLSAEYDRASGDGPGPTYGRFDTLFGMRRAELAPAGLYNSIGRANISTPALRAELAPSARFDAFAVYRVLWAADRRDLFSTTNIRGDTSSFAGQQLEARLRYWLVPDHVRLEANGLWLRRGGFLDRTSGQGDTIYASFQTTISF